MSENGEEKQESGLKPLTMLSLRILQVLSIAAFVVGFIWSTGDYITSLFPESAVVTPLSVLMMLYGVLGSLSMEGIIRYLSRKK